MRGRVLRPLRLPQPKNPAPKEQPAAKGHADAEPPAEITIDDFARIDLRLAKVINCELIEGADKLLKLTVKLGNEERTICSGIRKWYTPADMIGKTVVVVANLKPRKMRGIESHGMILCASGRRRRQPDAGHDAGRFPRRLQSPVGAHDASV